MGTKHTSNDLGHLQIRHLGRHMTWEHVELENNWRTGLQEIDGHVRRCTSV